MRRFRWAMVGVTCLVGAWQGTAATPEELRAEIRELKGKIADTKKQIDETRTQIGHDESAYGEYSRKHRAHLSEQEAEVDSLKHTHGDLQRRADSLAGAIATIRARQQQQVHLQTGTARQLVAYCDSLTDVVKQLPPGNVHAQLGALAFLRGELVGKAVDNVEAIERLWQILNALASSARSVEVYAGTSPVPDIAGQVDFVRLGHAYLAVVDNKGTAGALWATDGTKGGHWQSIDDPDQLTALRQCVRIRQGGAVPQLVNLPFEHAVARDTLSYEGGE